MKLVRYTVLAGGFLLLWQLLGHERPLRLRVGPAPRGSPH